MSPSFYTPGEQRLWESHLNNASWFPVERWLDLPLCEEFQYVVTLREPVPRLLHQCLGRKQLGGGYFDTANSNFDRKHFEIFTPLRVGWPPTPQVYFGP